MKTLHNDNETIITQASKENKYNLHPPEKWTYRECWQL